LAGLDPAPDLETALAGTLSMASPPPAGEQRHHARIPLQLPVELVLDGGSTIVALRDISRGGVRLDRVPADWLREMHPDRPIGILGLAADPLGRELIRSFAPGPVPAVALHAHPGSGLGARFLQSHPPV
jgi:hypothetical protein